MKKQFLQSSEFKLLRNQVIETFGSESSADQWLNTFNISLSATPLFIAESAEGLTEVKKILYAINYGGVV